jgi:uncharacterized protein involved in exopolysaccharide biosynthesis
MVEEQTKDLKDYLDTFRRRRSSILIISTMILAVSVAVAMLWPPTYRSTATILIEEQGIPADLVRSTITTYAWQRIQTISQRVMSRANLLEIVDKYKLYGNKRARETSEEIVQRMRTDMKLQPVSAEVIDPRTGRPTAATIAFTLSFDGENPAVTQKVVSELTTLYLNENIKSRTEKVAETYDFLTDEANKLNLQIAELETQLAVFKEKNINRLPELKDFNMRQMERTETELRDVQGEIRSLDERKVYLEAQLTQVQPSGPVFSSDGHPVLNKAARLKSIKTEYAVATAKYSPEHPDVLKLKREMEGLEKQTGTISSRQEQAKEVAQLRGELAAAREKYSAEHPDVIRLNRQIMALESGLEPTPVLPETTAAAENPDNPAYISLKSQLEGIEVGMRAALAKRELLKTKLYDYEKRIIQTPQAEREYLNIMRDYNNAQTKYREIKSKQMEAQVGQELEKGLKGERFTLIDPPQLPEEPFKPNRSAIIILGLLLSLGGGLGFAAVADSVDKSVRGVRGATELFNAPPLSVIPYLRNSEDLARVERTRKIFIVAIAGSFVLVILLAHFLWTPLDVLWFKGLRKVDTVIAG